MTTENVVNKQSKCSTYGERKGFAVMLQAVALGFLLCLVSSVFMPGSAGPPSPQMMAWWILLWILPLLFVSSLMLCYIPTREREDECDEQH